MVSVGEQEATFWGAAAQIVPVLALAIALEGRVLSRRFGRKKSPASRGEQAWMTIWVLATAFSLMLAFTTALGGLVPPPTADRWRIAVGDEDFSVRIILTSLALANGLVFAAYVPISRVVEPGLRIVRIEIAFWIPWSSLRRIQRRVLRLRDEEAARQAQLRSMRLDELMAASKMLMLEAQAHRMNKTARSVLKESSDLDERAAADAWLSEGLAYPDEFRGLYDGCVGRLASIDKLLRRSRKSARVNAKLIHRIDGLRSGDDKDFAKILRKLYADAALS